MNPNELPGVVKKSFSMSYNGGEIWFEHLDGIYEYTNIAVEKLKKDFLVFRRPSKPSLIAFNIDETEQNDFLLDEITSILLNSEKVYTRVVFVGADKRARHKIKNSLKVRNFAIHFEDDFEKAKEWLVSEKV